MNKYLVIFLGLDDMFSRKKIWHKGSPKSAIRAMLTAEMAEMFREEDNTPEDIQAIKDNIKRAMDTYTNAGGGVWIVRDDWGCYIATRID